MNEWKASTHHPLTVRLVKLAAQRMEDRPDALRDFTVEVGYGGSYFSIELHMLESLENPLMNLPVNRHDETFNRWIDEWFRDYLSAEPAPEPTVQAEPAPAVVDAPEPTAQAKPVAAVVRWEPAIPASVIHKSNRRTERLDAVIEMASGQAAKPDDWMSVWAALVKLAQSPCRPAPLLGCDDAGVKYEDHNKEDQVAWLKREAFRKRASRLK